MELRGEIKVLPLGSILDRYVIRGFLRIFFMALLVSTSLYLIVDCFDRISAFLDAGASLWTVIRYFFYTSPLSISRVIGFATLFSTLFSLGMLARTQEITAMRSSGLSVQRICLPIVVLSLFICFGTFFWNESLVPVFTHRAKTIYNTEIKNKQQQSLLGTRDIWIRGDSNFINVDNFDSKTGVLEGVVIFLLNRDFSLRGLLEIPSARWTGKEWQAQEGTEWHFLPDGKLTSMQAKTSTPISETPEDLKLLSRDSEEFTFLDLQKQIADMRSKGMDTRTSEVDLQTKLAIPLISPLMVLLAIPFALKKQISGGVALSFGIAMIIGFSYWVLSAFCISLGHSGALMPWIAAWIPNAIFILVGIFFLTAEQ